MYPAIVINVDSSGMVPWVVYLTPDSSIMRAIRVAPGVWDRATVYGASGSRRAGSPSLAVGIIAGPWLPAYVTYPVYVGSGPDSCYVYYNSFTPSTISAPEQANATTTYCYGTSVAGCPTADVHVAWIQGDRVYYNRRASSTWSMPTPISQSDFEPASNPSLEGYGDSLYCVWRGPHDAANRNYTGAVWRRAKSYNTGSWGNFWRRSAAPDSTSDFPVMTTDFATLWHQESTTENYDIWGAFGGLSPERFFETSLMSKYPHTEGYWVTPGLSFACDVVWTEQIPYTDPPEYEVRFDDHDYQYSLGLGKGDDYEPGTYYLAELGQSEPSPYCLSRGGYARFESWHVDTSSSALKYELPYLDPRRTYKLRAVIYHGGKETWDVDLRCDSGPWHRVHVGPNVPDTLWLQVPKALYKNDAHIVVEVARVKGDYVSLAQLKLFQLEPESYGQEGVQSAAGGPRTRLLNCAPNPFSRIATVSYELGQAGPVALTVHDVSGRLVRRLESGYRFPGRYEVGWNATDDHGRRMPAGIYFLRFNAGGQASSHRVTLVR